MPVSAEVKMLLVLLFILMRSQLLLPLKTGAGIGNGKGGEYNGEIYIYGGDIKAYSTDGQGIGKGLNSIGNIHNIVLGDTDLARGILQADIHSVNNYALSKFTLL